MDSQYCLHYDLRVCLPDRIRIKLDENSKAYACKLCGKQFEVKDGKSK